MCLLDVVEVDECLESDICDQLCVHRNGSLTCECQEGYHMDPLTQECKAEGEPSHFNQKPLMPLEPACFSYTTPTTLTGLEED